MPIDESFLKTGGALGTRLAARICDEQKSDDDDFAQRRVGQKLGAYALVRLLGSGGVGDVYLAERNEGKFTQQVALKLLRGDFIAASTRDRFEQERQILAGLIHPGIAPLLDVGRTDDGQPFYTMEYVQGEPISDFCRTKVPNVDGRVRLLMQVAQALAHAHRNLIVHRDIKPSNILVQADGQVKLLDFGIAKLIGEEAGAALTRGVTGPMTPEYAAPEQFRSGPITVATDVYQFGVLCFRVLTGQLPYQSDPSDRYGWSRAVAETEPMVLANALTDSSGATEQDAAITVPRLRRQLTRDLDAVLRKAMAKLPRDRYGSMDALLADLGAYLYHRPVSARRAGTLYFLGRYLARRPYSTTAGVFAALGLIVSSLIAFDQARSARMEAKRANAVVDFLIGLFKVSDPGVNRGEKLNANEILDRGAERVMKELDAQPATQAKLLRSIGEVYVALGDFPRAQLPLQQALSIMQTSSELDPVDFGYVIRMQGLTFHRNGDAKSAIAKFDEAEDYLNSGEPRGQRELVALHGNRADARRYLGDFAGARIELEVALEQGRLSGTSENSEFAPIYNTYGNLLWREGDLVGARNAFESALSINQRDFGDEHQRTSVILMNLASVFAEGKDYAKARPLMEAAAANFRKLYGEENSTYIAAQSNLGELNRDEGRLDQAVLHYSTAIRACGTAIGVRKSCGSSAMLGLGLVEMRRRNFESALAEFEKALALRLENRPADHIEVADAQDGRGQALLALNRSEAALRDFERALEIRRAKLPADNSLTITSLLHLGLAHHALNDSAKAKLAWDEALVRGQRAYSRDPKSLAKLRQAIDQREIAPANNP